MVQPPANSLYKSRLVLRCTSCVFILISLSLQIAEIVLCEKNTNRDKDDPNQQCWDGYPGNKWPLIAIIIVLVFGGAEVVFMRINKVNGGTKSIFLIPADVIYFALLIRTANNGFYATRYIDVDGTFIAARVFILLTGFVSPLHLIHVIC
jgi:hypothetical protein